MKIGVTGWEGTVGSELVRCGCEPIKADITDIQELESVINDVKPDVVIHCAAVTSVPECETDYKKAFSVNVRGTSNLTDVFGGTIILLSSDHVFSGKTASAYREYDAIHPVNRYGMTKVAAEEMIRNWRITLGRSITVRTSKLFDDKYLGNLAAKILAGSRIEVTNLIYRSFLYVPHFCRSLLEFSTKLDRYTLSVINLSGSEIVSYYQFYKEFAAMNGYSTENIIARNKELKDEIPRPMRGGLDISQQIKLDLPTHSYKDGIRAWSAKRFQ